MKRFAEVAVFGPGEGGHAEETEEHREFRTGDRRNVSAQIPRAGVVFLEFCQDSVAEPGAAWRTGESNQRDDERAEAKGNEETDRFASIKADDDFDDANGDGGKREHQREHDGLAGLNVCENQAEGLQLLRNTLDA